ncbi:hypothetical protein EDD85DRAFT_77563 [Armillaria nabsnona]|nr:hypothetical protein EDD85DRAFT_77563 [Armillaria nabsnona]
MHTYHHRHSPVQRGGSQNLFHLLTTNQKKMKIYDDSPHRRSRQWGALPQAGLSKFPHILGFVVVVVASLAMVFKQASQSSHLPFLPSIPISASRPWRSSFLGLAETFLHFYLFVLGSAANFSLCSASTSPVSHVMFRINQLRFTCFFSPSSI